MVNAAEAEGVLSHMVASIQGLCRFLAEHYTDGIPVKSCRKSTFRDLIRKDNILQQQEKFRLRGELETKALEKLQHAIGRTDWDHECVKSINPDITYHFCNETLRENFYEDSWQYHSCTRYRIFASACNYPIKGFHYLLEAFARVVKTYPDATLAVTGSSFLAKDLKGKLRQSSYETYLASLAKKYRLEDKLVFLGHLSAEKMKQAYLNANVFVLPSTLENSPNSLGEAMLLGVPSVAANVGGVRNLMKDGSEGRIYEAGQVDTLAKHILELFALEERAAVIGCAARNHALATHDPEKNLRDLMNIYEEIR
jgi:glycosyltransferase involved in cell wall biosynthesis